MIIQFTARHFHASDALKENTTEQLRELTKYYENIISAHLILEEEDKDRRSAEIILGTKQKTINSKGHGEKMGIALDEAFTKIERQLKKLNEIKKMHKEKGHKHHSRVVVESEENFTED